MILSLSQLLELQSPIDMPVIVGSGLAGLALAERLSQLGVKCVILESGNQSSKKEWDITTEAFNQADYGVSDSYAQLHVRREVGGGSSVWGGWCSTLRDINFNRKDITGYKNWPVPRKELLPYYRQAGDWLKLDNVDRILNSETTLNGEKGLAVKNFGFSPPVRYGSHFQESIKHSESIFLVPDVTVSSVENRSQKKKIISLKEGDKKQAIHCRGPVVLAGGAVGNARILSKSTSALGIPSESSAFIGRYFYEHPHCYALGKVFFLPQISQVIANKKNWSKNFISIAPTAKYLAEHSMLDFNFQLTKVKKSNLNKNETAVYSNYSSFYGIEPAVFSVTLGMEQLPLFDNTVLNVESEKGLNDGHLRLALEVQKPLVESAKKWLYLQGVHAWVEAMDTPVQAVGHLQGTTRMGAHYSDGVVDSNCQVFGVKQLYVAGSSVFPAGGFVNPTMTIVALSIRLAEYIARN